MSYFDFISAWNEKAASIHAWAKSKGWWESERNDYEMIALMHSELSEAVEALREHNPASLKAIGFRAVEEELADVVIRIMDTAHARGWDVAGALERKMVFNESRSYRHGGKDA